MFSNTTPHEVNETLLFIIEIMIDNSYSDNDDVGDYLWLISG